MPAPQWLAAAMLGGYGLLQQFDYIPWTLTNMSAGEIIATCAGGVLVYAGARPAVNARSYRTAYHLLTLINAALEPHVGPLPIYAIPLIAAGIAILWLA